MFRNHERIEFNTGEIILYHIAFHTIFLKVDLVDGKKRTSYGPFDKGVVEFNR